MKKLSDFTQYWPYDNASTALSRVFIRAHKNFIAQLDLCRVLVTTATELMDKINSFDILSQFLR